MVVSSITFLAFLTLHGLLFLGVGYLLSFQDPGFAILHSGLGILVYSIFFKALFPHHFRAAFMGAIISVGVGLYFGDWIMDSIYSSLEEPTRFHKVYGAMLTLYIYLYLDVAYNVIRDSLKKGKEA